MTWGVACGAAGAGSSVTNTRIGVGVGRSDGSVVT